jgi:hypothetical protein
MPDIGQKPVSLFDFLAESFEWLSRTTIEFESPLPGAERSCDPGEGIATLQ